MPMHAHAHFRGKNQSKAILTASPLPTLVSFAVPIILGNIFQQLYNIVDAIVVGQFLGDLPLAGISVASPVMDILYALLLGSSIGIGVLIGRLCGAGDEEEVKKVHATAILGGSAITIALSAIGFLTTRRILAAQGTEEAVIGQAMSYLTIILGGLIFCFLYNYFAAALRSSGDSRTPFIVLLVSSVIHALLDIFLCGVLHLGIYGVACSTVFCQVLSTLWLILSTEKTSPALTLTLSDLKFHPEKAGIILSYAWAAALQQAVVMIGRFLVQGMLTPLGTSRVTGYNMALRVEQFLFCFSQGISASMVVAISQNLGHGNRERVGRYYRAAVGAELFLVTVLSISLFFFRRQVLSIFSSNPEVITAGALYAGTMMIPYYFAFLGEVIQGFFRGIGRLRLTMIASMLQIVLRVILSWLLIPVWGMQGICAAIVTGWVLLVIIEGAYSLHVCRRITGGEALGPILHPRQ